MTQKKRKKAPTKKKTAAKKNHNNRLSWLSHPLTALAFLLLLLLVGGYIITRWSLPEPVPQQQPQPVITYPMEEYPAEVDKPQPPQITPPDHVPKVAIIMDDIGINRAAALDALQLQMPLALAIIPGEAHSTEIMNLAYQQHSEILIHIPMEPVSYPKNNPGPLGLFVHQSDSQIKRRIDDIITALPYAIGGNNHMGSEFTQHADKLRPVLLTLKQSGLFFVDSLTSKDSVAYQQAQKLGLSCALRDVFLDNVRQVEPILFQLDRLVTLAHRHGSAIAICHPYPQTIEALQQFIADPQRFDVEIVPISQLVHPPVPSSDKHTAAPAVHH
ncbi:divergent polysaccharide deacetylase family protein [Desulfuromonas acetoxidans]|uniref:divergent polysaccharide deacetylase family protein n=1 Tax=Desulfuromonas acetoxidans TaxID=891 RepID=UPI0029308FCF|nr:divergent polysaccharide deacetylase family protein [Desulfuromonas acetoxidans]